MSPTPSPVNPLSSAPASPPLGQTTVAVTQTPAPLMHPPCFDHLTPPAGSRHTLLHSPAPIEGDDLRHLLTIARQQETPATTLGKALAIVGAMESVPAVRSLARYSRTALIASAAALTANLLIASPAVSTALWGVTLLSIAASYFCVRRLRFHVIKGPPEIKDSFGSANLARAYQCLFVESDLKSATSYFSQAAQEATSPYDRARALYGLVTAAQKSTTVDSFLSSLQAFADYLMPVPPPVRFGEPSIQLPLSGAIDCLAKRMSENRFQSSSVECYVNAKSCLLLAELFRSLGPPRVTMCEPLLTLANDLDSSVPDRPLLTQLALAELRGVLRGSIVPGGPVANSDQPEAHR